jgi:uncharacterized membrane protein YecN with MAPEG domain
MGSQALLKQIPKLRGQVMLIITPFYAALLALFYVGLSFNVIRHRFQFKQSLGTGGEQRLQKMIRMHGNFSEYVPLIIIMMSFLEMGGNSSKYVIHGFGVLILIGRIAHAYGLGREKSPNPFRVVGMLSTFSCMIGLSIRLLMLALEKGI